MIISSAVLGTILGGITGVLPGVVDLFTKKQQLKYEAKMLELRLKSAESMSNLEILKADALEGRSLREHDSSLGGKGFINGLRASIRPVITYLFFALFLFVKIATAYVFIKTVNGDVFSSSVAWNEFIPIIWDSDTNAIFGAVVGFWFGDRAIQRLKRG